MNIDFNNITTNEFCDLQGVSDVDRFVINKLHKGKSDSYENWYKKIQVDFQIGAKKDFKNDESIVEEVVAAPSKNDKKN